MNTRVLPILNKDNCQSLRHSSTVPDLKFHSSRPPPPRRRGSEAELRIPKRKDSITFFASPYRNRKNATWTATTVSNCMPKLPLSNAFASKLTSELDYIDETRITPRQPRRQNAMVRLTPTQKRRKEGSISVLPRLGRPLV